MAEELPFAIRVKKMLFGFGIGGFGPEILAAYRRGGPGWTTFVEEILTAKASPLRKTALDQLLSKGLVERSTEKARLVSLLTTLVSDGIGEERRRVLAFIEQHLALFPVDDDAFRGRIFGLQRSGDPQLANAAEELLPKLGFEPPDRSVFKPS